MKLLVGTLALAGFALLICGIVATLAWRKEGVTVGALFWAGSDAAAHPERYVRPGRVGIVRVLKTTGVGLILSSVLVLVGVTIWYAL